MNTAAVATLGCHRLTLSEPKVSAIGTTCTVEAKEAEQEEELDQCTIEGQVWAGLRGSMMDREGICESGT
jgi:hypothetical protein